MCDDAKSNNHIRFRLNKKQECIIFRCEKICKFENQGYNESTPTVGIANIKDVVQWGLGLLHQQAVCGYG